MTVNEDNDFPLPELREDIQLLQGPTALDGSPTWTMFDPIRNRYFKIGWLAFQLLSRWSVGTVKKITHIVKRETTCNINEKDVEDLIRFLYGNNLTRNSANNTSDDYYAQYQAGKPGWIAWCLKNYLFLRLPLVRPNIFFQKIIPYLDPLFSHITRNVIFILGLLGLYLVARQWDTFVNTFLYFFTLKGAIFYFIALVFIKVSHELGHALTATRYGCKIPTMGIALLVLFPMLYTDTSDAYRLTSRSQRLTIGAAGILTEFYLALICIFLWSFLPDGLLRSTAFVVATVSFSLTLLMNINPFMRFDGYYILSDWLGIENLQSRSFALGKWKLREVLFALNDPQPEKFSEGMQKFLIIYAWCTWIYRFFLLIAIAFLVYYFFFKLLGIILFVAAIYIFILMPIIKEMLVWWGRRNSILRTQRSYLTVCISVVLLLVFFIPWNSRITFPAILGPIEKTTIYAPAPGRIGSVEVVNGAELQAGDIIIVLDSPGIDNDILRTEIEIEALDLRLQRIAANAEDLFDVHILHQQLKEQESKLTGLVELKERLVIRSTISGTIVEIADSLHPGRWINETLPIAFIVQKDALLVEGMVYANDLARLEISQDALFIPDDVTRDSISVEVSELEYSNITNLDVPYFASTFGGEIAVRQDARNHLVPETSVYRIKLLINDKKKQTPNQVVRGIVHVEGEPKSFANRVYETVAAVLIRGSGF